MPFRHLVFSKRNGAPRRNPDQQPISLDEAAYFSIEQEFPSYDTWPDHGDAAQLPYNGLVVPQTMKQQHQQYPQQFSEVYDQSGMFPYGSAVGVPYQTTPYDFDSSSLQYSSDMMDTDVSSISRGSMHSSISSTSHLDIRLDDDTEPSSIALSRKPSIISSMSSTSISEPMCPLLAGQVHECDPGLCGSNAPCLEYVNERGVPPIEQCLPERTPPSSSYNSEAQNLDFTRSEQTPQRQEQSQPKLHSQNSTQVTSSHRTSERDGKSRSQRMTGKSTLDAKEGVGPAKQTKKSRARQAHSLVERKYRENLNAKIQELYLTLRRVRSKTSGTASGLRLTAGEEIIDEDDLEGASLRVKKSDVLIEAMNYVHATEAEMKRKDEEIEKLTQRITLMEGFIRSSTAGNF